MLKFEKHDATRTKVLNADYFIGKGGFCVELTGYELVAIVDDEHPIEVLDESKEKQLYAPPPTKQVIAKRSLFVFQKADAVALEEAESRMHAAESAATTLRCENKALELKFKDEIEPLRKRLAEIEACKERLELRQDDAWKALSAERTARIALETDLAKVRRAVGDLRWKEITGT